MLTFYNVYLGEKDYCRKCAEKTNLYCICRNVLGSYNVSVSADAKCNQINANCFDGKYGKLCACEHFACHCRDVVDDKEFNDETVGVDGV